MSDWTVPRAAAALLEAADTGAARAQLTGDWPGLDLATAYAVQDEALRLRQDRGERLIGVKLDAASSLTGWLTDAMAVPPGAAIPRDRLTSPRAWPQIVFVLGSRLAGPGVTAASALAAVAAVRCGIEVTDVRYRDFAFTRPDAVADNGFAACFLTGPAAAPPGALDLSLEACLLEVDGQVTDSATGAAVLGHPAQALAWGANELARRGLALQPGWMVLTGGLTSAVACPPGVTIAAHFTSLGSTFLPR